MLKGLLLPLNYINQVKDIVLKWECSTHGRDRKCFSWNYRSQRLIVGARRRWRNIVKNNLKRRVKVWIVFIWHATHSVGGLLFVRRWNCDFINDEEFREWLKWLVASCLCWNTRWTVTAFHLASSQIRNIKHARSHDIWWRHVQLPLTWPAVQCGGGHGVGGGVYCSVRGSSYRRASCCECGVLQVGNAVVTQL
jgi:hypothetical protein